MDRVKAVACVDMTMDLSKKKEETDYILKIAMQFQASSKPLGDPISLPTGVKGVSAGHTHHDYAPGAAIDKIFEFFKTMS